MSGRYVKAKIDQEIVGLPPRSTHQVFAQLSLQVESMPVFRIGIYGFKAGNTLSSLALFWIEGHARPISG